MTRRAMLICGGVGGLLLAIVLIAVIATRRGNSVSPKTPEEKIVRDAILDKAGKRAAEMEIISFEDVSDGNVGDEARASGARAILVRFHGPSLMPTGEWGGTAVGTIGDYECIFMVTDGKAIPMSHEAIKR